MFISRVEIPWEAARNPYEVHRRLWRMFPGERRETRRGEEEERSGFLFRVEERATGRPARVLVQSRLAPAGAHGLGLIGSREFHPTPSVGQRLAFVLTANPVKTIVDAQRDSKPGKQSEKCRVPLVKEGEQRQWLARKLAGAADVEGAEILSHPPVYFRKGNRGGKLVVCTFEGILRVTSPDPLNGLLENGIGPAKSFGCGLLLVRRP
ncbi:MAG TPA: type I-E CRISPR-associated protein Cas6/Cse3/CasE [Accumulibacter sp.]|uniref:type I-E CRISPR-associated protein Cas6/Cse3/CasE n=1 Tax=Accumulibacter sp. TaxID=2053492 RepID=UPI0025D0219B|nr:type I-E CRISPR-associated protein Cas6/Cse3/CasE [Accumulibacter sp.]MCM8597100.1 type I-E CRISPR-associated protein Cas6/Cse3/CasE [Accumulibacter sp.]HNF92262.1 type I-E CRISPR-associated protein Cas6/Cse3/CasE [Accumulibacter sp.]